MKNQRIQNISSGKGFTLIELLVVIAIIGLLASVVLVSLNSARAKSRDAKRRGDLRQIATALALYYNDNNAYPNTGGAWYGNCSGWGGYGTSGAGGWIPNLAPTYMAALPLDPKPIEPVRCYIYKSNSIDYKVLAYAIAESTVLIGDSMYDPVTGGANSFGIWTPGGSGF